MRFSIGFLIAFFVTLAVAADEDRIAKEVVLKIAKAQFNSRTAIGSAYDRKLSEYFVSLPGTELGMSNCLRRHPGAQSIVGFFEFHESGLYVLHLEPKSSFSACISKVYESKKPPQPPTLPYLNEFSFQFDGK